MTAQCPGFLWGCFLLTAAPLLTGRPRGWCPGAWCALPLTIQSFLINYNGFTQLRRPPS
jgi:hypothetical protein